MKLKLFFTIFTAVCLLALISGCGGKKSSSKLKSMPEQNQPRVAEPEAAAPEAPRQEKKKKKKKKVQTQEAESKDELPEELRVQEMTLPVQPSQWTEREFTYIRSAQKDLFGSAITELTTRLNNPETADASAALLLRFVHSVVPAALAQEENLRANEKKFTSEEGNAGNERGKNKNQPLATPIDIKFYQLSPQLIREIFLALGASTCETAKRGMAAFLAGTIITDDNKSALDSLMMAYAIKAQDDKISKEEEDLLLAFLLTPEKAVQLAAEYAEVEAPAIVEVELDQNGNPLQKNQELMSTRVAHSPITISPEKRVQFRFEGGNGTLNIFTHLDVQKMVLTKFCPASSPLFRAQVARALTSPEVAAAADTQAKQAFLRDEVLEKFLLQSNFTNVIAHILIARQPNLDEKWKAATSKNLFDSCISLMRHHFGFLDSKMLEEYEAALQAREARKRAEKEKERKAVKSAEAPASTAQAPVSLLSRQASVEKKQNVFGTSQIVAVTYSPEVELLLNPKECDALEKEVWTPETREFFRTRIEESLGVLIDETLANMPELGAETRGAVRIPNLDKNFLQAVQMYLLVPCVETRKEIYRLLDKAWILGPEPFRQTLFERLETEPGFLMVVKSLDRRVAPKEKEKKIPVTKKSNKSSKKRVVKEREKSRGVLLREKKIEVGTAWMNQTYRLVCQWCGKFSEAAQTDRRLQELRRISNPNLPKLEPLKLSEDLRLKFQPVNGMEVVGFYTASDPEMPPIAQSSGLKITFLELRCTAQLSKLISSYKSKIPHLLERGKLDEKKSGGNIQGAITNANWLEYFAVNEETGRCESVDVLIAPSRGVAGNPQQSDAAQPRKGAESYSVYVLVMEMDDLAGDHVSNLSDADDESDEGEDEGEGDENPEDEEVDAKEEENSQEK